MTPRRWRLVMTCAGLVGVGAWCVRTWSLSWGSTRDEQRADLAGDALIADPDLCSTRAVTVDASAASVWPWIAQLGQSRGGLYSYDWLENLIGCNIHSADRVVDEWQNVEPGDAFRLHPDAELKVAIVDAPHALVVRGAGPVDGPAPPFDFTWAFTVHELTDDTSRLVVRERYRYARPWVALMVEPVELVSFVMSQKMLRGIRDRAEAAHRPG